MKTVLFYCPQMEALAKKIVVARPDEIELGSITWDRFKDGFPNIFVEDVQHAAKRRGIAFLASFDTPGDIFEQYAALHALPDYLEQSLQILLPYFPTGTMERVDELGQVATASTLASLLSSIPPSSGGPPELVIYDIHALGERHYFDRRYVKPRLESGIPLLKEQLAALEGFGTERPMIAFPDDGAWKRFHRKFPGYHDIVCQKVRDGDKRIVTVKEGNPAGRHVVIIDDLVQTGGTLHECRNTLVAAGAVAVSAYATHGVFPEESWRTFTDGSFANIWITDSCPKTAASVSGIAPFRVLSLAGSLAEVITD